MAAFFRGVNSRIRSNEVLNYIFSTHFIAPVSTAGIPLAAIADIQRSPEQISPTMTAALAGYSAVFMPYAFAVTPKNYLLFICHFVNESAQLTQAYRYINHNYMGGREKEAATAGQKAVA